MRGADAMDGLMDLFFFQRWRFERTPMEIRRIYSSDTVANEYTVSIRSTLVAV